jgi:cellobiose transport system permease protein
MTVLSQSDVQTGDGALGLGTPRRTGRRSRSLLPGSRIAYVYVLPFFLVFAAFSVYPWAATAWVSLHDTRLSTYNQSSWIGLENYHNLFTNKFFWNAFRNTISIGIISTVPQLCMALGIAHLLNYRLRGRTFYRVAILMPYATSLAAATVIFAELFDPKLGLINWSLHTLHLPTVDWQGSRWPSQIAVSTIVTWRWTGYNALIYLAGMQAISTDLYEAAAMDGAGRWAQFRNVTLPGLRPTILFTIVVSTIGASQLFGEPLLYHNGLPDGGTQNQYQTLGLLMYQQGWTNDRLGLASATAWTMFLIIVVAVSTNVWLARRRERHEGRRASILAAHLKVRTP